jgi:membrane associated rhomboid family serine protease
MVILYPLLAIASGLIYTYTAQGEPPHPLIGASGAIMGLAGMYLVMTPTPNVHMVAWWRWIFMLRTQLYQKIFAWRGFWVLLFYISFDVIYTTFGIRDSVAHWAHLGGFLAGMALGLLLLVTRLVNARGGDLLTALLGRRAWPLVGKPDAGRRSIIAIV